jgi:hypothetical protein
LEVGFLHRIEPALGQGLPVDLRDEVLDDFPTNLVGEMELEKIPGNVSLSETRETGPPPDTPVGLFPGLLNHVRRRFHLKTALACLKFLDGDFH